ncbi:MAG: DUF1290 domain-containing protein [Ruminococcaceae bacterium]|nr:DUF1290 domain-containing protein [Oscillospiraceae bacterium]
MIAVYMAAGLIAGGLIALFLPITIPAEWSPYVAIALLGALDSTIGGVTALLRNRFQLKIFLSGFFSNALLAGVITYIGNRLDLDLFLAAVVVFGTRIFQNFADMRSFLLTYRKKKCKMDKKNV